MIIFGAKAITPLFLLASGDIRNSTSYAAVAIVSKVSCTLAGDVKAIIIIATTIKSRNYKPTSI